MLVMKPVGGNGFADPHGAEGNGSTDPNGTEGTVLPIPTEHVVGHRGERFHRLQRIHTLRGELFHRPQRIMPSANKHRVKWADWDWPVPTVFANGRGLSS